MSSPIHATKWLVPLGLAVVWTGWATAQTVLRPQDGETLLTGGLPGDQVQPAVRLKVGGGFLVWQDNVLGGGFSVAAQRLEAGGVGRGNGRFQVSQSSQGQAEKPQVEVLNNGGAVMVWQAGRQGFPEVFARFTGPDGTFTTDEIKVSAASTESSERFTANWAVLRNNRVVTRRYRLTRVVQNRSEVNADPAVAVLPSGEVVVAYAALRRYTTNEPIASPQVRFLFNRYFTNSVVSTEARTLNSMMDIAVQRFSATGQKLGELFVANRNLAFNQREPAVAALAGGRFVVVWVSEHKDQLGLAGASLLGAPADLRLNLREVYARVFDAAGLPLTDELLVSSSARPAASPAVAALPDGGFRVVWAQLDPDRTVGWDVYTKAFGPSGESRQAAFRVNSRLLGNQYLPAVAASPQGEMVVWTSFGQDGSQEGVYGQWLAGGVPAGGEFGVNSMTEGRQIQPTVAADGAGGFLAVWATQLSLDRPTSGDGTGYELMGQRFVVTQP